MLRRLGISIAAAGSAYAASVSLQHSEDPVPTASYLSAAVQRPVREQHTGALIHVLGVTHNSPRSLADAAALCDRVGKDTHMVGVAVELDSDTASYLLPCVRALSSHTIDQIRNNGEKIVQQQLFLSDTIHKQAADQGRILSSGDQIVVPTILKQTLRDGVIWGQEMAVAVEYANDHQLAVAFLDLPAADKAINATAIPAVEYLASIPVLGQRFVLRLFHRCRHPALSDECLEEVMEVDVLRAATKEFQPTVFELTTAKRDRFMAKSIAALCVAQRFDASDHVVVIIGAMHVPGVRNALGGPNRAVC